jgi:hypothetical protein
MATVNLGSIKFKWKGTYAGGTAYTIDDVVSYNGSSYICIQASTGNLPTDTAYFEQMSQKGTDGTNGTDGTDLTTTLTTQGDILYRDGSGLQRLGAGTSGQALLTGGAGANPSWGTVSSDFVKLATLTASNNSSLVFDGYFSSTYTNYKIIFNSYRPSTDGHLLYRVRVSNSDVTTGYYGAIGYDYADLNNSTGSNTNRTSWGSSYNSITQGDTISSGTAEPRTNGTIDIFNPLASGSHHFITSLCAISRTGSDVLTFNRGLGYTTNSSLSGISILPSTGTMAEGTFKLYGIK